MSRREIITKRVEYVVPTSVGWGATHTDLLTALKRATEEYHQLTNSAMGGPLPDDVIRVMPGDGEVVIFFVLEERK